MKRLTLFLISSCAALFVCAQEEILFDSIPKNQIENKVNQLITEKSRNSASTVFNSGNKLTEYSFLRLPAINVFNKNLDFGKIKSLKGDNFTIFSADPSIHPIFPFGYVFNQSTFRINNQLLFGGNSFGANSVFEVPKLNSTIQEMSIKGASLFMQYKVSNHVKVQTRVSISNRNQYP